MYCRVRERKLNMEKSGVYAKQSCVTDFQFFSSSFRDKKRESERDKKRLILMEQKNETKKRIYLV